MHILLIHQSFAALDEPGGTRHHELARYLAAKGHRITVIASRISYLTGTGRSKTFDPIEKTTLTENLPPGRIDIQRVYTYPALHRSFIHRLLAFFSFMTVSFLAGLRVRDVDLVWGTSPPIFQGITAWALALIKRVPFLFEVRDLWPAFAVGVGVLQQPVLIHTAEWLERFLYRQARLVVVNSPGFIDHVRARGARQVELVPNGSDTSMFDPNDTGADFKRAHGLEGKFTILYTGAHGISNDLEVVLDAATHLEDEPEVVIVLLGDGKEKPALVEKAASKQLGNVLFLPPIPKKDIPPAIAAADACLAILKPIPEYATVYPNKVFDYMAAGRPVILAIEGVIRQVLEQAEAGIAIPPGDAFALSAAIRYLHANRQDGKNMGSRGRAFIRAHYDRPQLANLLFQIIEQNFRNRRS